MIFRMRTEMINLKENMKNEYKGALVNCDACDMGVPESQTHVMTCPGYEQLRARKNMDNMGDLTAFFRGVLLQRERKKLGT